MSDKSPYRCSAAFCRLSQQASLTGDHTEWEGNLHLWLQVLQTELS